MRNLAEKYRPRTFEDFKGSPLIVSMLKTMVEAEELPSALLFTGDKGVGKRLEINTPVLTPTGWVPIKDLTEGDEVIGSNGRTTKVTYASPPVSRPLYEICFSDGASVLADPDHLWEVRNRKGRSSVKTTQEIVDHWERVGYLPVYSVPTVEPVQFPEASLDIPPYMMGSLLADGYLKTPQIQWTKNDEGVIRLMAESASLGGWSLQERTRGGSRQWAFHHISDPLKEYHDCSFLATVLQELGLLGKGSADKFIPEQYFTASETQRRDLLTGLFDGDGRLSSKGTPVYHSTSHQLAIDVRNLCWSLGMGAHLQAQKPDGTWPVLITSSHNPFRGALHVPTLKKRVYRRRIVDIVPKERGMGRCISVDSEDHLYVAKDYIVTHNTSMCRIINRGLNGEDSSLSYIEVDAASNSGVDNIRSLQEAIRYSHPGEWRIVVLDEALALDTPIPTPDGWSTVEEIQPGDLVIGSDGCPTKVIRKTDVFENEECYRVHFSDGTSVVTSANHKWMARRSQSTHKMRVFTTEEMFTRGHQFRIPAATAWDLPEASLPVPPYLLGIWLGDGSKNQLHVSGLEEDLIHYKARLLEEYGLTSWIQECSGKSAQRLSFSSHRTQWDDDITSETARNFRKGNWMNNKHIPDEYFRGSIKQREALLQGLMDTDGWVSSDGGNCTFVGTERLCKDVQKLLTTLGIQSSFKMVEDVRAKAGYGKVNFSARRGIMPVSIPRKAAWVRQVNENGKCDFRTITHIEKTSSVPTQCIEVESEDHLFLVGEGGHVTHNCHNLSNAAFNSLLKVLEDPPPKTTFILVTTRPESIPDTVKSRSMIFRFQNPGVRTVLERLVEVYREEGMEFEPRVLARIAQVSEGTLRGALVLLQQVLFVPNPTVETVNILSGFTVSTKDLMYAMLEGKLSGVERELSSMFADSGDVEKFLLSLAEVVKEFYTAGMLSTSKFLNCMKVIWSMRKIQGSSDMVARTQLEAGLFAMFLENFWDGSDEVEESGGQPVTMEDLQEFT